MGQAIKAVMHCQHVVALEDPDPDSWTNCRVHPSAWSSNIQYSYVDVALGGKSSQRQLSDELDFWDWGNKAPPLHYLHLWEVHVSQHSVRVPVVLKAPGSKIPQRYTLENSGGHNHFRTQSQKDLTFPWAWLHLHISLLPWLWWRLLSERGQPKKTPNKLCVEFGLMNVFHIGKSLTYWP